MTNVQRKQRTSLLPLEFTQWFKWFNEVIARYSRCCYSTTTANLNQIQNNHKTDIVLCHWNIILWKFIVIFYLVQHKSRVYLVIIFFSEEYIFYNIFIKWKCLLFRLYSNFLNYTPLILFKVAGNRIPYPWIVKNSSSLIWRSNSWKKGHYARGYLYSE